MNSSLDILEPQPENVGVTVKLLPNKGRCLYALKSFEKGDVIFEEKPLVCCQFAWNQDYGYAACDHCLRPLESPIENVRRLSQEPALTLPYLEHDSRAQQIARCRCGVNYCSSNCQNAAAEQYHASLCAIPGDSKSAQLLLLKDIWKKMHYPPESATVMLILRIYARFHQSPDKEITRKKFENFAMVVKSDDICHKLLGAEFQDNIELLRGCLQETVQCFGLEIPPGWITPEGFRAILALLGTNSQGVGTSALGHWVASMESSKPNHINNEEFDSMLNTLYSRLEETVGLDFLDNEGSALFSLQHNINHSCSPNVEVNFPRGNFILAVRALKQIVAGEEICSSYLDECALSRSRHSRQAFLRDNYLFQCMCLKCEEQSGDPDVTSDEEEDEELSE